MGRVACLVSLVVLCAGLVRAEADEAPLVLGGSVPLVERWSLPRPAGEVELHYATSGWYDLLVAYGARLDVVDRASGQIRAAFDVGCEVRDLMSDLVLCDEEVRWIADLRSGLFVPLQGLPEGVTQADSRGEKAAVLSADGAFLFRLPSKLDLKSPSGEVAPFRLTVGFAPRRVSFAGYDIVVVEGAEGERAFFHSASGAPLEEPPRFLDEVRAHTLLDEGGARPAAVDRALQPGVFLSPPRWKQGGVLLHVRDAAQDPDARELLVIEDVYEVPGTLLYVVDEEGVRAYSTALLSPSDYQVKSRSVAGALDVQALTLFGAAAVGVVASPTLLWALQPDLGPAAIGVGLLAVLGAVPLTLGIAALGVTAWLTSLMVAPRPRAHTGSSCANAGLDAVIGPAHSCAVAIAAVAALPFFVVGAGLVAAAPFVLATMTVADPALSALDPVLLAAVTTTAAGLAGAGTLGVTWLVVPLPDDDEQEVFVVLARLAFATATASVAGAGAYAVTRAFTR